MSGILVHEWLSRTGGSENVFEVLADTFPDARRFALGRGRNKAFHLQRDQKHDDVNSDRCGKGEPASDVALVGPGEKQVQIFGIVPLVHNATASVFRNRSGGGWESLCHAALTS